MEYSLGSSVNKSLPSKGAAAPEESGWTAYFQDFSSNNNYSYGGGHSGCSSFGSSSLLSDASSGAAWKLSRQSRAVECSSVTGGAAAARLQKGSKKVKKIRSREASVGDSLEDTASSPVNSPKMDKNASKMDDSDEFTGSMGRAGNFHGYSEVGEEEEDERNEMNYENENGCATLKKKGLRLVPLSTVTNYLG